MIEFRDVDVYYRQQPFMTGLNLAIPQGEITCLVGPNGCGKSTVLRLACGLQKPQGGAVWVNGKNVLDMRRREVAKQMALLQQNCPPVSQLAEDVVLAGRYPHRGWALSHSVQDRRVARQAMARTNCDGLRHLRLDHLSGGERQRVLLAAALAQDTPMLLLDEPTTYLDIQASMQFMELVRMINDRMKKTVVLVLHDLSLALRYAHTLIVLNKGAVVAAGEPAAILEQGSLEDVFQIKIRQFREDEERYFCFR